MVKKTSKNSPGLAFLLGGASSSDEESSLLDSAAAAAAGFAGAGLAGAGFAGAYQDIPRNLGHQTTFYAFL